MHLRELHAVPGKASGSWWPLAVVMAAFILFAVRIHELFAHRERLGRARPRRGERHWCSRSDLGANDILPELNGRMRLNLLFQWPQSVRNERVWNLTPWLVVGSLSYSASGEWSAICSVGETHRKRA